MTHTLPIGKAQGLRFPPSPLSRWRHRACAQPPKPQWPRCRPGAVGRQHRRFNQRGTGAAHPDPSSGCPVPARAHDDRRRRGAGDPAPFRCTIAIAAQVQAFAAQIQRDVRRLLFSRALIRGSGRLDRRSGAAVAEFLRVSWPTMASLTFQRAVLAVTGSPVIEARAKMHREGGARVEHLRPRNGLYAHEGAIQIAVYATFAQRQHDCAKPAGPHQAFDTAGAYPPGKWTPPGTTRQSVALSPSSSSF